MKTLTQKQWLNDKRTRRLIKAMKIAFPYFLGEEEASEGTNAGIMSDRNKMATLLREAGVFGYPLPRPEE